MSGIETFIASVWDHSGQLAILLKFPSKKNTLLSKRRTPRGPKDYILTDHEVELVRVLREDYHMSLSCIAEKMEVSKSHIFDIVTHRRRPYAFQNT